MKLSKASQSLISGGKKIVTTIPSYAAELRKKANSAREDLEITIISGELTNAGS